MSALEEQSQDDEERARQQDQQPDREPLSPDDDVHKEGDRDVGDEGEERGTEPPRGNANSRSA